MSAKIEVTPHGFFMYKYREATDFYLNRRSYFKANYHNDFFRLTILIQVLYNLNLKLKLDMSKFGRL